MLKDYELKDKILQSLIGLEGEQYCTVDSLAAFLKISDERTYKLIQEIVNDTYCTAGAGWDRSPHKYIANKDTQPFLQKGGYTKLARIEYWKNFPKDKWYLLDPVKFLGGAIVGAAITLAVQRLTPPKSDLPDNTHKELKNTNSVDRDSSLNLPVDSSKRP
jgi:hypothetical protein